jgi:hypothetical protein
MKIQITLMTTKASNRCDHYAGNYFQAIWLQSSKKIEVDQPTFDKVLGESVKLFNIDAKRRFSSQFSLADLIIITEEKSKAKERKHRESLEM